MYDNLKCPYCGSGLTEQVDYDFDNHSEKRICRDCEEDYIAWFDENDENVVEITNRHNMKLEVI